MEVACGAGRKAGSDGHDKVSQLIYPTIITAFQRGDK